MRKELHSRSAAKFARNGAALACLVGLLLAIPVLGQQGKAPASVAAGDVSRGKALVESSGCLSCHRIEGKGAFLGPDLTDIGRYRSAEQLQRSLVSPDEEVLGENRQVRVVTKAGATVTGKLLNQDAFSIELVTADGQLKSYVKDGLREHSILTKGLMPPVKLSESQVNDMVAYLYTLKGVGQ